jgi:hypothetical protein
MVKLGTQYKGYRLSPLKQLAINLIQVNVFCPVVQTLVNVLLAFFICFLLIQDIYSVNSKTCASFYIIITASIELQ